MLLLAWLLWKHEREIRQKLTLQTCRALKNDPLWNGALLWLLIFVSCVCVCQSPVSLHVRQSCQDEGDVQYGHYRYHTSTVREDVEMKGLLQVHTGRLIQLKWSWWRLGIWTQQPWTWPSDFNNVVLKQSVVYSILIVTMWSLTGTLFLTIHTCCAFCCNIQWINWWQCCDSGCYLEWVGVGQIPAGSDPPSKPRSPPPLSGNQSTTQY
jgi:hypothetical protein